MFDCQHPTACRRPWNIATGKATDICPVDCPAVVIIYARRNSVTIADEAGLDADTVAVRYQPADTGPDPQWSGRCCPTCGYAG